MTSVGEGAPAFASNLKRDKYDISGTEEVLGKLDHCVENIES